MGVFCLSNIYSEISKISKIRQKFDSYLAYLAENLSCYNSRLPFKALESVISSAYSRSLPIGKP
jgi:hypothetical protein